jgi:hypothetical protein
MLLGDQMRTEKNLLALATLVNMLRTASLEQEGRSQTAVELPYVDNQAEQTSG